MSAPVIADQWQKELRSLRYGWNGDKGEQITDAAIWAVESFHTVPCSDGGIQLQIHRSGWDIEIVVDSEGEIISCLLCKSER